MYGSLPRQFAVLLDRRIAGRRVMDLGSGDEERSNRLIERGASAVLCIDKQEHLLPYRPASGLSARIAADDPEPLTRVTGYFIDPHVVVAVRAFGPEVAHLAWPVNYATPGLCELLDLVSTVVYIGSNTTGNACGTPELFEYFRRRELRLYRPDPRNTLIVYGPRRVVRAPRSLVKYEELAALDPDRGQPYPYNGTKASFLFPPLIRPSR